ncbi:MAG: hypothetical protein ACR2LG_00755 [Actinomycetota bacterium]
MIEDTELREILRRTAEKASLPPVMPAPMRRRIRVHKALVAGGVAAAVVVIAVAGAFIESAIWTDAAPVRPAEDPLELPRHVEVIETEGPDLVAVDPRTGKSRVLVHGRGEIGNAAFSPDGRWLAFDIPAQRSPLPATPASLWVMDAELEPRRLAVNPGRWAWSPTDAQLAMMRDSTLTLIDPSTGRKTDLGTTFDDDDITGPVWSPDGTRIVFGVRGGSLYSVDVGSGDRSLLVRLQGTNFDPHRSSIEWSPDGSHVAILADLVEGLRRLYVMNADGSGLRVLADDFEPGGWGGWFPGDPSSETAWSPDGTRLTYPAFSGPDQRELEIWTASLDGSAPSLAASHTNDECCIDGGSPVWSPDGSQIAFATDKEAPHEPTHIAVNADGTGEALEIDSLTYLSWRGGWYFCYCYG